MSRTDALALSQAIEQAISFSGTSSAFYQHWWSGHPNSSSERILSRREFHEAIHSIFIETHIEGEVQSTGSDLIFVEPGEYLFVSDVSRLVSRWKTWSNQDWQWHQSSKPRSYPRCVRPKRVYIPSAEYSNEKLSSELADLLERRAVGFRMKRRLVPGLFRDSVVIYTEQEECESVLRAIAEIDPSLSIGPPPLAKNWRGIGIVDDRLDGESVGWEATKLIWRVTRTLDFEESLGRVCSQYIVPAEPWLIYADNDSFWRRIEQL